MTILQKKTQYRNKFLYKLAILIKKTPPHSPFTKRHKQTFFRGGRCFFLNSQGEKSPLFYDNGTPMRLATSS